MKILLLPLPLAFMGFSSVFADPIISSGDPVIAVDEDITSNSGYPAGESPGLALDGSVATKYLNFGRENSGLIITPVSGGRALRSFAISTANDSPERDPASVLIYGTNSAIASNDNSAGVGESWTRIAEIPLTLPLDRQQTTAPVNVANEEVFTSYKFVFPSLKGPAPNSMQISELQAWDDVDGTGLAIFGAADSVLAVHEATPESSFPAAENPGNLFDGDPFTKYLNFGIENSGFIVTPSFGPSVAGSFILSTANDFPGRDPVLWEVYGTNASILTESNGTGQNEPWSLIASGTVDLPVGRNVAGPEVFFENVIGYTSYKFIVREIREIPGSIDINSTQYSEFQLFTSEVPLEIQITSISPDLENNEITLTWDAPPGILYTLEASLDLLDWDEKVNESLEVEVNSPFTFQPPFEDGRAFYRIIPTPNP